MILSQDLSSMFALRSFDEEYLLYSVVSCQDASKVEHWIRGAGIPGAERDEKNVMNITTSEARKLNKFKKQNFFKKGSVSLFSTKTVFLVRTERVYDTVGYPWTIQTYSDKTQIQFRDLDCERGDASMRSWEVGEEPEWFQEMVIGDDEEMAFCPDWYCQNPLPSWFDGWKPRGFFMCSDSDSDEEDAT